MSNPKLIKTVVEAERLDAAVEAMNLKIVKVADIFETIVARLDNIEKSFTKSSGSSS